ncbi:glycosyltransferase [Candidatus Woesearchaeota archaeon]|nr:glycosyltransferase [Candidatus Woesearchaeota archaeon]
MKASVIVVTYNEERNIADCLNSLVNLDYNKKDYEILVVDGNSSDKTKDIAGDFIKKFKNKVKIRLINNPKRFIASSRNVGLRNAAYELIAFTDADCIVPKDWLKILVEGYEKLKGKSVAAVGGANIPPKNAPNFMAAVGIAFDSFLGSLGSAQAKKFSKITFVPSLPCCNALHSKKLLLEVGGFDEKLRNMCEDYDVNFKLRKRGYKIAVLPNSFVWHKLRSTPMKFLKNMYAYGKGRIFLMKRLKEFKFIYLLPIFFIVIVLLSFLSFFNKLFLIPLLYFPLVFLYSLCLCMKKGRINLAFHVFLVFVLEHFGYAVGEIAGLLKQ